MRLCSTAALAKDVTVMISGGFKAALEKLAPEYEAQSGDKIILASGPSMGKRRRIPARLARGEQADVLIMVGDALTQLEKSAGPSRVRAWSWPIRRSAWWSNRARQAGDKTDADLRKVLLQADSFAYSDSASGRYVSGQLFKKLVSRNR